MTVRPIRARDLLGLSMAAFAALALTVPASAGDLVQEDTGIAFPDTITIERGGESWTLGATGVGIREATMLKVNVYAIASYVEAGTKLGLDPAHGLVTADAAKRLRMEFVRDVEADKVTEAYRDGVKKNMEDMTLFEKDFEIFLNQFQEDLKKGDVIVLTWLPRVGLITEIDGKERAVIENPALGLAIWSIWFGDKPVSKGMKKDLLSRVSE